MSVEVTHRDPAGGPALALCHVCGSTWRPPVPFLGLPFDVWAETHPCRTVIAEPRRPSLAGAARDGAAGLLAAGPAAPIRGAA